VPKSLKEQNLWKLWLLVSLNTVFLYGVIQADAIEVNGLRSIFTEAENLIPVAMATVLATVLNGFLSANAKARLVFLRWSHALPGHRVFSQYAPSDPRIDLARLERMNGSKFPTDHVEQNRVWYRIYKTVENLPSILQIHRDFLLLRDYTGLSVPFLIFYGAAGLYAIPSIKVATVYLILLLAQYVIFRQSASNYGIRMVTNVLAEKSCASH
jgi:hypothetical protein